MLKFGASSFISQVVFQRFTRSTNNVVNILTNSVT